MSTLFSILGAAKSGLYANQLALQTTANNVANANSAGYSRQRVDLREALPEQLPVGQLGTGVLVDGIRRLRDQFADTLFRQANQTLGERDAKLSTLQQIQGVLGEPSDSGLQASLAEFFAAAQTLANDPTDLTARTALKERGMILAGEFNRLQSDLTLLKRNLEGEILGRVGEANDALQQIATLNGQIQAIVVAGGSPNELLDQRDKLTDDLSQLVAVTTERRTDGTLSIGLLGGGGTLVDGTTAATLSAQQSATTDDYQLLIGGTPTAVVSGALKGLLDSRNDSTSYVKYAQSQLDALACGLIQECNRLQAGGAGLQGLTSVTSENAVTDPTAALTAAGLPFTLSTGSFKVFVYDAAGAVTASGTVAVTAGVTSLNQVAAALSGVAGLTASVSGGQLTVSSAAGSTFGFAADTSDSLVALGLNGFFSGTDARTLSVSAAIQSDVRRIASATPDPTTGAYSLGDNSIALALAQRRQALTMQGGSASFDGFLGSLIGTVAARTQSASRLQESQSLVAAALDSRRQEVSGVSVDEEMANLVQLQRTFEASARMIRVVDEILNTVVNSMGT
jgi:flagellar hook-associated protein 1 FlgK